MISGILFITTLAFAGPAQSAPEALLMLRNGPSACAAAWVGERPMVVTAYHCVLSKRPIRLVNQDDEVWFAELVSADRFLDLAILRVEEAGEAKGLEIREDAASVGESVKAWGHPYAQYSETVPALAGLLAYTHSSGFVSGTGALLQLDMAFNPGVSGGPVLDANGRLLGVASRKLPGEHLSFAAPASEVRPLLESGRRPAVSGRVGLLSDLVLPLRAGWIASAQATMQVDFSDWVLLEGSFGWPLGGNWSAASLGDVAWRSWSSSVWAKFRVGSGPSSLSIDGGVLVSGKTQRSVRISEDRLYFVADSSEPPLVHGAMRLNWKGGRLSMDCDVQDFSRCAISIGLSVRPNLMLF